MTSGHQPLPCLSAYLSETTVTHVISTKQNELKTKQIKKRSLLKIQRAVGAFEEVRQYQLELSEHYNNEIFDSNLDDVVGLTKENLTDSLCLFISEVTKVKMGSMSRPNSLSNGHSYPEVLK